MCETAFRFAIPLCTLSAVKHRSIQLRSLPRSFAPLLPVPQLVKVKPSVQLQVTQGSRALLQPAPPPHTWTHSTTLAHSPPSPPAVQSQLIKPSVQFQVTQGSRALLDRINMDLGRAAQAEMCECWCGSRV